MGPGVAFATAILVCCYASKIGRFLWFPGVAGIDLVSYSLYLLYLTKLDYLTVNGHVALFLDGIWPGRR